MGGRGAMKAYPHRDVRAIARVPHLGRLHAIHVHEDDGKKMMLLVAISVNSDATDTMEAVEDPLFGRPFLPHDLVQAHPVDKLQPPSSPAMAGVFGVPDS